MELWRQWPECRTDFRGLPGPDHPSLSNLKRPVCFIAIHKMTRIIHIDTYDVYTLLSDSPAEETD
jgi:hypothetical protein